MNVEIGTEATQFLFCEYLNGIFFSLQCTAGAECPRRPSLCIGFQDGRPVRQHGVLPAHIDAARLHSGLRGCWGCCGGRTATSVTMPSTHSPPLPLKFLGQMMSKMAASRCSQATCTSSSTANYSYGSVPPQSCPPLSACFFGGLELC